jgi:transposase
MTKHTLYVGLDTAKTSIVVAVAEPLPFGAVRSWGKIANTPAAVERLIGQLRGAGSALKVCYEAGPCGYGLYRQRAGMADVSCVVAAPSLIPRAPGARVKTDRRDALKLATLLRAAAIVPVWVPDRAHEAMRDLVRARAMAVEDVTRCRQRIGGFLLRQGIAYVGKAWSKKQRGWLGGLAFAHAAQQRMVAEFLVALDQAEARRDRLTEHIAELVPAWSLAWLVEALQALRGYRLIHAATLAAEIGDPRRFDNPRQLMAFVGLVPSEYTTAERVRRGRITKAGNRRARKVLIEAAWSYARAAKGGAITAPPALAAIAEKARHRLSRRYRRLVARGKRSPVAVTAIAREALGFVWAIARAAAPLDRPPAGAPRSRP